MGSAVNRRQIACQMDDDGGSRDLRYVGSRKSNISRKLDEGRDTQVMKRVRKRFLLASSSNVSYVRMGR